MWLGEVTKTPTKSHIEEVGVDMDDGLQGMTLKKIG